VRIARASGMLAATWRLASAALALEAHVRGGHDAGPPPELSALATAIDGTLAAVAEAARTEAPPTSLPRLRPLHDDLVARVGEDDFVAAQLDRMVDAVDTMAFLLGARRDELVGSRA
jgi:hypothetical protein